MIQRTWNLSEFMRMNNRCKLFSRIIDTLGLKEINELLEFVHRKGWFPINRCVENVTVVIT